MTTAEMSRALVAHREAAALKAKFDGWALLKPDAYSKPEVVNVGEPVSYEKGKYNRTEIPITDEVRRLVFRHWRKGIALQFNQLVRELNQLGVTHELRLIQFNAQTGEPA